MSEQLKDGRRPGFWWASNRIIDNGHMAKMGVAFLVYACLCRRADADGVSFPSISTFEADTGLSRQCVIDSIKKLVEAGHVEKLKKGGPEVGSNVYVVKDVDHVVNVVDQGGQRGGPGVVHDVDSKDTHKKETKRRVSRKASATPANPLTSFVTATFCEAWQKVHGVPHPVSGEVCKYAKDIAAYCCKPGATPEEVAAGRATATRIIAAYLSDSEAFVAKTKAHSIGWLARELPKYAARAAPKQNRGAAPQAGGGGEAFWG